MDSSSALVRIVRRFRGKRLLVVGDLMLDHFVWGKVERISPEAPVPVVNVVSETHHLGGAANVAANVRALGGRVDVVGVVGRDGPGAQVLDELRAIGAGVGGIVRSGAVPTTRKTRILAHQQQVVRLDREQRLDDPRLELAIRKQVRARLGRVDAVIVSDYAKGVVSTSLLADLASREPARPPLFIDPKKGNFSNYRHATLVKPNLDAAAAASGVEIDDDVALAEAGRRLLELWHSDSVLLSRGDKGMALFERGRPMRNLPTAAREVFDVTGAGDTVLATVALAVAAGATLEQAAMLANRAAGLVVAKRGTATVSADELLEEIRDR